MGTLNEDLSAIKEVEDKIVANKVARFAYTNKAYTTNDADGVDEYDVNNAQNIPTADASVLKVNETVLSKGYRAQASSITRMLVNHFFGRMSYNLNKVNDNVSNLIATLIGHRGTANGFATLDENGRVPYSQLPESAMEYKGQWNAETNTPALADGTGTKGDFYIVSVSGTQNLGSGNVQFFENDRIIYDGSVWSRLSAGDVKTVNSVLPANGNVALTGENIPVSATNATLLSAPLTTDRYADSSVTNAKIADNAVTNAKIKDPVSVDKGGTGATSAKDAFTNLANGLSESSNPLDTEYMIYKSGGGWGLYTLFHFWEYIKGKISSVLGLTKDNYGGKAAKAANADTAVNATYAYQATRADTAVNATRADTAVNATRADTAVNATRADTATNATRADTAVNATRADTATNATRADTATNATRADTATNAYNAYSGMVHTCHTDSATVAKTVSIPGFTLTQGACIRVFFINGNSVAYPTLNVNDTGAKEIKCARGRLDTAINNDSDIDTKDGGGVYTWNANGTIVLDLYYDGSYWRVIGDPIVRRFFNGTSMINNVSITGINQESFLI